MEELLPIGSVVLLQDGVKKIMITGYMAVNQEDEQKIYDYSGCIYPEGLLSSDQCLLFFHNQIKIYPIKNKNRHKGKKHI